MGLIAIAATATALFACGGEQAASARGTHTGLAVDATQAAALKPAKWTAYSKAAFAAAQAQGRTILVDVHADWCPTCKAQAPILDEIRRDARSANTIFFRVDFDKDKAFLKEHRIPRQSTVLLFKGKKEVERSIAETDRARLRAAFLRKA